jgi:cell division septum initiation protein DivIVA
MHADIDMLKRGYYQQQEQIRLLKQENEAIKHRLEGTSAASERALSLRRL